MNIVVRVTALVFVVALSACGGSMPTSPSATSQPPSVSAPTAPPARTFPPLSGPSRTFVFQHELAYPVRAYTKGSLFVLYENGAFVLRYPGIGEYRGGYTEANGTFTFEWEGWSSAGPWGATGTLKEGVLTVQYNFIMQMSDFEDAAYVLTP